MGQIDDLIKKLLEEKTASANSHLSQFGSRMGVNKVLNNPLFQKLRLAAIASKAGLHQAGAEEINSMFGAGSYGTALANTSGAALGLSTPFKGSEIARQVEMANVRKRLQSQAGYNNTAKDAMASTAASMANLKSLINSTAMLTAAIPGMNATGMITAGGLTSSMFGGLHGLGAATAHGLANGAGALGAGHGVTAALGGMNPMMMGMVATIAATKASSMMYKTVIDGGSSLKLGKKALITSGTSTHQLEQDYGNTGALRMQINRMQNTGMMKPSEALIANILAMIEGHTSVLPYIAANAIDSESRRNKESAGNSQNHLEDLFGDTGVTGSNDQLKKGKMGIVSKLFTGMEKTTANLSATFDIMGQLSNTLSGHSSTKLYNEANSKDKTPEMLKAEKKFGETFGIPTGMVQAIHTTPAQIMNASDTYEGKVLSLLGLNSEINRFSAHELLKIRTTGFGIKNDTTNGFLAKLTEEFEEERLHKDTDGVGKKMLKGMDEILGFIPGFQVLSGSIKMFRGAMKNLEQFEDDLSKGKVRSVGKVFTDWMEASLTNDILNSETALRKKVGATELGAQDQMANYLGIAYPDRFELLLSYNLSQMESLKVMAGNVDYSQNEKLTMNKYTGVHGNADYHKGVDSGIKDKMEEQMDLLNDPMTWMENMFFNEKNLKKAKQHQVKKGMETNDFLKSFIEQNPDSELKDEPKKDPQDREMSFADFIKHEQEKDAEAARKAGSDTAGVASADDMTKKEQAADQEERKMSFAEQQVALLQEIRDCCTGQEGRDYDMENARMAREKAKNDEGAGGVSSILSGMTNGVMGSLIGRALPILPRFGLYGIAAAAVLAAGYMAMNVFNTDNPEVSSTGGLSDYGDAQQAEINEKASALVSARGNYQSDEEWTKSLDKAANLTLQTAMTQAYANNDNTAGDIIRSKLTLQRHQFISIQPEEIFQTLMDNMAANITSFSVSIYRVLQNDDSLKNLFWANTQSINRLLTLNHLSPGMMNNLRSLFEIQKSLDLCTDQKQYSDLIKKKYKLVNDIAKQNNKDVTENNNHDVLTGNQLSPYTLSEKSLNNATIQQNLLSNGIVGATAPNQETVGMLNNRSLKGAMAKFIRKHEGNYDTVQMNDGQTNNIAFGRYQLNEQAGKLKDFLVEYGKTGDKRATAFANLFDKSGTFFQGTSTQREALGAYLKSIGNDVESKKIQDKIGNGYLDETIEYAHSIGIKNEQVIGQMMNADVNMGLGGIKSAVGNYLPKNINGKDITPQMMHGAIKQQYVGIAKIPGKSKYLADWSQRADEAYDFSIKTFRDVQDMPINNQALKSLPSISPLDPSKDGSHLGDDSLNKSSNKKSVSLDLNKLDADHNEMVTHKEIAHMRKTLSNDLSSHDKARRQEASALIQILSQIEKKLSSNKEIEIGSLGNLTDFLTPTPTKQLDTIKS